MPNTSSAKKALRNSLKKRDYNTARSLKIKNSLKELRRVLSKDPENYQVTLSKVYSSLDKAVKTNLVHHKTASRKKSRMAKLVARTLSGKETVTTTETQE